MDFVQHDLGHLPAGAIVRIDLTGNACNVQLLDEPNFRRYRARSSFRGVGGHYTESPAVLQTPRAGHWYVALDLAGRQGRIGSSVSVVA